MSLGELQEFNWAASGCARRSFFVCFSYNFRAALIMGWKLDEEEEEDPRGLGL